MILLVMSPHNLTHEACWRAPFLRDLGWDDKNRVVIYAYVTSFFPRHFTGLPLAVQQNPHIVLLLTDV